MTQWASPVILKMKAKIFSLEGLCICGNRDWAMDELITCEVM
jgi:hypothetical protein